MKWIDLVPPAFRSKKANERLNQNDWAQQYMSYNGNVYPLMGSMSRGSNHESIENDYQGYVRGAYKSSGVVFACILAVQLVFSEVRFQYQQLNDGRPGDLFNDDAALEVLKNPWPRGDTGELVSHALQDYYLAGNHYVLKEFVPATDTERPHFRLRWLRPDWVDIILTKKPEEARDVDIAGHLFRPGGTENRELWEVFPIDGSKGTIAHWCMTPDPEAMYRGISPLQSVIVEVMADKAATKHKAKFFENAATPNLAVSFKETVTEDQFKTFMEQMDSTKHGVEHAYETLYLGGGADVTVVGAKIEQMDFRTTLGHGETRVAAALRIHPTIVGLAEGMHGSTLNEGNFKAAKNMFADGTLKPMWHSLANAYSVLVPAKPGARLWYDDRDIAFLRQDRLDIAQIQEVQAQTISALIQSGYTADSSRDAVVHNDMSLLVHTGLFSVQLLPPGTMQSPNGSAPSAGGTTPAKPKPKPGTGKTPNADTPAKGEKKAPPANPDA